MYNWKNILINPADTIETAVKVIDKEALRIALVIDAQKKILGTVTDGDIRRALINQLSLTESVEKIMNSNPKIATINEDKDQIRHLMQKENILQIPVVDGEGVIVGLETLHDITKSKIHLNPVFIMAGGFGTRLHPITRDCPKPMLHLGGQPILESILRSFINYGFVNFYFSVHYLADKIMDYFQDGSKWGVSINYIHEKIPLGTGGAIGLLPKNLVNYPLILMNGDILTKINFEHLLQFHNNHDNTVATVCVRQYDFTVPYGVIQSDAHRILNIIEKPAQSFFVNAGIYVLNKEIVESVGESEAIDMPDLLTRFVKSNHSVVMFPIHEYWLDVGRLDDFSKAKSDYEKYFEEIN